jgi:hypothetical protein
LKPVENLSVNSENLSASRSRIMDADFAAETANLSRTQILQQVGTAMVAQANQLPQQVLCCKADIGIWHLYSSSVSACRNTMRSTVHKDGAKAPFVQ